MRRERVTDRSFPRRWARATLAHRMDERAPAVRIRGLRQSYRSGLAPRRREVLHGLDLDVARGEFVGLVGPNGSGKSTLLRVIAAVDEPSEGSVEVFGRAPDSREAKRGVGYCPEDSPFPPELPALDALALIGSLYGLDRRARRARAVELLERVGLSAAARQPLGRYSRGMLRRFGLAQALVHEPELLLLDEPTAGLDALGLGVAEELFDELRARRAAVVLSSHLFGDLHERCDRIAVLIEGRIAASGSAGELVHSLGPGATLDLTVGGLDTVALAGVAREVERLGGRFVGARPSQENLLELYRRHRGGPAA
jgi:ABC-2 type transport system ATP-binding protein